MVWRRNEDCSEACKEFSFTRKEFSFFRKSELTIKASDKCSVCLIGQIIVRGLVFERAGGGRRHS